MKLSSRQTVDGGGELGTRVDTIYIMLFNQKYYSAYQDFLVSDCLRPYLDGLRLVSHG